MWKVLLRRIFSYHIRQFPKSRKTNTKTCQYLKLYASVSTALNKAIQFCLYLVNFIHELSHHHSKTILFTPFIDMADPHQKLVASCPRWPSQRTLKYRKMPGPKNCMSIYCLQDCTNNGLFTIKKKPKRKKGLVTFASKEKIITLAPPMQDSGWGWLLFLELNHNKLNLQMGKCNSRTTPKHAGSYSIGGNGLAVYLPHVPMGMKYWLQAPPSPGLG